MRKKKEKRHEGVTLSSRSSSKSLSLNLKNMAASSGRTSVPPLPPPSVPLHQTTDDDVVGDGDGEGDGHGDDNDDDDDDGQSSLDLSLCLRRGSNDSRDSFYMDFDRGIDSDIDLDLGDGSASASTSRRNRTATTASTATARQQTASESDTRRLRSDDDDCTTISLDDDDDDNDRMDMDIVAAKTAAAAAAATPRRRCTPVALPRMFTATPETAAAVSRKKEPSFVAAARVKDDDWMGLNRPSRRNRLGGEDIEDDDVVGVSAVDDDDDGIGGGGGAGALPPSPVCSARMLASPELLGSVLSSSQGMYSGKELLLPNGNKTQPIICSAADRDRGSGSCRTYDGTSTGSGLLMPPPPPPPPSSSSLQPPQPHLKEARVTYPGAGGRKSSRAMADGTDLEDDVFAKTDGTDSVAMVLSGMYAKLLVVMGIGFPLSEVISPYIPPSFFVGFYLYLYSGSILFLIYAYSFLLHKTSGNGNGGLRCGVNRNSAKHHDGSGGLQSVLLNKISMVTKLNGGNKSHNTAATATATATTRSHKNSKESGLHRIRVEEAAVHCGSFYLRMGAVAFGIGSMIYSGLEFGQFFELDPDSGCYSVLMAVTPCAQMAFTFIQLYFIFMNSKMCIYKFKNVARFGLMHMVATNLCVWLHVLVQESKHEILKFIDPSHGGASGHHSAGGHGLPPLNFSLGLGRQEMSVSQEVHHRVTRGLKHPGLGFQCRRVNIMGQLVQDVSPFLFPCTIEYSLICAAIIYMMWKNIGKRMGDGCGGGHGARLGSSVSSEFAAVPSRRHHYSVDCAHANKGLFTGILVFVLAIISLILFFVLVNRPEYKDLAVFEAHISELVLYCLNIIAAVIALMQVRELRYSVHHFVELDSILLVVAQTGVYLFSIFCVIGGHFTISHNTVLVLLTAIANLVQATVQTIFVLDASRRHASTSDQVRRKPGREMITFLLVCNLTMWAINALEIRRSDANPTQLNFYGFWAWTIISHVSSPLAIFFRFHSTVCLCEIWKKLYKLKAERV